MKEKEMEYNEKMAAIEARKKAFEKSPFWFTVWDTIRSVLKIGFWIAFWSIIAQCHCNCIWH